MGKKIEELDKVITLMEKTKKLFVIGVLDAETTEQILNTCKETVYGILKPVMPAPAQPDPETQTAPEESEESVTEESIKGTFGTGKPKRKRH